MFRKANLLHADTYYLYASNEEEIAGATVRPTSFEYHRAESLNQAVDLLASLGEEARPLAGGYSLVPMMNLRLAQPEHLVDINPIGLDYIRHDDGAMRLGGLVRHCRYAADAEIRNTLPLFSEASRQIAHPVIRLRGTLGGSLAHADPTAELALMAVVHGAVIHARSARGARKIAAAEFFQGAFRTALEPGELVVELEVPVPAHGGGHAFLEFSERQGDFAIVAVAAMIDAVEGRIAQARIACAGAQSAPVRDTDVEAFLVGRPLEDPDAAEAGRMLAAAQDAMSDIRASAEYRRYLIAELVRRAVEAACDRARSPARSPR